MKPAQINFVKECLPAAVSAGAAFNLNPLVILAQASYPLNFRRYDTRENSFLDFARLIRNNYRSAWQVSNDPQAYAKEIAYSPYISELNGDNRETYRHSIIQITQTIQPVMALIGE